MKIATKQPYGGWELQILIEDKGTTTAYEISTEEDTSALIADVDALIDDLIQYRNSFDPKD